MSRLLITRPLEDAQRIAARLEALGHRTLIDPMLEILWSDGPSPDLTGIQALLFTSANGVRAFARRTQARDRPVLAVGRTTAEAARAAGFEQIATAGGDVQALARLVETECDPAGGALFHAAGSAVAGDLAGALAQSRFQLVRQVLYQARPAERLGDQTTAAWDAGAIDRVLLFSPRTASHFLSLLAAGQRLAGCGRVEAVCLSAAVADAVRRGPDGAVAWAAVRWPERPDQDSMIAEIMRREPNASDSIKNPLLGGERV